MCPLYIQVKIICTIHQWNCIDAVMVSMPRSGKTKDYNIGICSFSAKQAALRRKRKVWLARNQDVSE